MKQEIFEYNSIKYIIEIGENKKDNFDIIDLACETDIWFHVKDKTSCHVILKTCKKMKDIPRQVIKRCAYLCKINSKSKTDLKCDICYTTINNVKKTEITGQVETINCKIINI